eukprot:CAMPEP_0179849704 /NCGR_PEP_ID=MMETSP0982-20121206/7303_1 /TAXON_ID=483367 /ORGANISM="non described non described, Strain CCMP 2436" /LENGTH=749 /DNA_ID=CAMNT_0021735063 /DNA_START=82 /DNA_END=2327 /DNA_ORIENTATION=+
MTTVRAVRELMAKLSSPNDRSQREALLALAELLAQADEKVGAEVVKACEHEGVVSRVVSLMRLYVDKSAEQEAYVINLSLSSLTNLAFFGGIAAICSAHGPEAVLHVANKATKSTTQEYVLTLLQNLLLDGAFVESTGVQEVFVMLDEYTRSRNPKVAEHASLALANMKGHEHLRPQLDQAIEQVHGARRAVIELELARAAAAEDEVEVAAINHNGAQARAAVMLQKSARGFVVRNTVVDHWAKLERSLDGLVKAMDSATNGYEPEADADDTEAHLLSDAPAPADAGDPGHEDPESEQQHLGLPPQSLDASAHAGENIDKGINKGRSGSGEHPDLADNLTERERAHGENGGSSKADKGDRADKGDKDMDKDKEHKSKHKSKDKGDKHKDKGDKDKGDKDKEGKERKHRSSTSDKHRSKEHKSKAHRDEEGGDEEGGTEPDEREEGKEGKEGEEGGKSKGHKTDKRRHSRAPVPLPPAEPAPPAESLVRASDAMLASSPMAIPLLYPQLRPGDGMLPGNMLSLSAAPPPARTRLALVGESPARERLALKLAQMQPQLHAQEQQHPHFLSAAQAQQHFLGAAHAQAQQRQMQMMQAGGALPPGSEQQQHLAAAWSQHRMAMQAQAQFAYPHQQQQQQFAMQQQQQQQQFGLDPAALRKLQQQQQQAQQFLQYQFMQQQRQQQQAFFASQQPQQQQWDHAGMPPMLPLLRPGGAVGAGLYDGGYGANVQTSARSTPTKTRDRGREPGDRSGS